MAARAPYLPRVDQGAFPVDISTTVQPRLQTSLLVPCPASAITSGAIQKGVPFMECRRSSFDWKVHMGSGEVKGKEEEDVVGAGEQALGATEVDEFDDAGGAEHDVAPLHVSASQADCGEHERSV